MAANKNTLCSCPMKDRCSCSFVLLITAGSAAKVMPAADWSSSCPVSRGSLYRSCSLSVPIFPSPTRRGMRNITRSQRSCKVLVSPLYKCADGRAAEIVFAEKQLTAVGKHVLASFVNSHSNE